MFTWICPKCGAEVPPSENDCPNCRARAAAAASAPATPVSQSPEAPPAASAPSRPVIAPPPVDPVAPAAIRKPSSLSPALVALCSAVGIVALLAVLYVFVLPRGSSRGAAPVELEKPGVPASNAATAHPLAKYIEITGVRVMEGGAGQAKIAFVAVNHSPADLPALDAHLTLSGAGQPIFDFPVLIPSIGPYESKDISSSVKTNLKPYELPDWQTLKPSLQIVAER